MTLGEAWQESCRAAAVPFALQRRQEPPGIGRFVQTMLARFKLAQVGVLQSVWEWR